MKFLVTGASGYIGGHLVQKLSERGIEVRAFIRRTSNIQRLRSLKKVETCYGDLTEYSSVKRAVEGTQIVYHIGGLVNDWGAYQKFYQANFLGTKNILRASISASVKKFIYTSTIGVLDLSGRGTVREDDPYGRFLGSYRRSKAEAERLVKSYSRDIPIIILRPAVVYGPRDPQCTLRSLRYARKHLLFLVDKGKGFFPHLYIDNLIDALLRAAKKEAAIGEIFNLTDGANTSTKEFFSYINRIAGKGKICISLPYPVAWIGALFMDAFSHLTGKPPLLSWTALEFLTLKCRFNISKAREKLGFKPSLSLSEGMDRVNFWWRQL